MNMNFLRKLKLILYGVSLAEIFIFGYLADKTGGNTKMAIIALALIAVNIAIYKTAAKNNKKRNEKDGV
jgi:hypothetical protein